MMDNRTRVVSNFLWRFFERIGAQMITVIVNIILARKLGPGPAGKIAIVLAVTNLLKVFAESGMGTALIQKKDADDLDFSSVFQNHKFLIASALFGAVKHNAVKHSLSCAVFAPHEFRAFPVADFIGFFFVTVSTIFAICSALSFFRSSNAFSLPRLAGPYFRAR